MKTFKEFMTEGVMADRKKKRRKVHAAKEMLNLLFQKPKTGRRLES